MASSSILLINKPQLLLLLYKSSPNYNYNKPLNFQQQRFNLSSTTTTPIMMMMKPIKVSSSTAIAASDDDVKGKSFVDEMRFVAMKLHTREQSKQGQKEVQEPQEKSVSKWEYNGLDGYLKFLVDSKFVYDTIEDIVQTAPNPIYAEFRDTGLERSESLAKDLEWFKEQGYQIPEPSAPGVTYASYLKELSVNDPPAFICHFYNVYFAHTAGGRMIGRKVSEKLLDKKVLEFYKWDGDLPTLLQNVREKLNKVAESWTREEKDHCLEETAKSFKHSGELLRLIFT
ncbi:hypothetical protein ACFE04_000957 [Oxalis oulophora]